MYSILNHLLHKKIHALSYKFSVKNFLLLYFYEITTVIQKICINNITLTLYTDTVTIIKIFVKKKGWILQRIATNNKDIIIFNA